MDTPPSENVRPAAFAGSWYPGAAATLAETVDRYLAPVPAAAPVPAPAPTTPATTAAPPVALIVPHAGYRYSGPTAGKAFSALPRGHFTRVLLLGPSHRGFFAGLAAPAFTAYQTPLGRVPVDTAAAQALRTARRVSVQASAEAAEHSLEIELPFLQRTLGDFHLLPVLVGELRSDELAAAAAALRPLLDPHTLVVASSDFTHYGEDFGYVPFRTDVPRNLERLDRGAIDPILARDADSFVRYQSDTGITVCGYRPIALLLSLLPAGARGALVEYTTSGHVTGDFEHCVSYAAISFAAAAARPDAASLGRGNP